MPSTLHLWRLLPLLLASTAAAQEPVFKVQDQNGRVLGKALAPFEGLGTGVIDVLVNVK